MARRRPPLGVWLYGMRIAEIAPKGNAGRLTMRYTDEACERWPSNLPVLSCSLPLGRSALNPTEYFRGLLPEGRHLQHLAAHAKVSTSDLHGMLARFGRDVAGAVIISVDEPIDRPGDAIPYDAAGLTGEVSRIEDRPLALHDDSELSIPGLQNKLLLIKTPGGWARPAAGRPSTHILKVEDRRHPGLVRAEHAAMSLARGLALTTAETEVVTLGGVDCIIVSRFDRTVDAAGTLRRIHQEDVCQALGLNAQANYGKAKYESHGGPGLVRIGELLDHHASDPERELIRLVKAVTFTAIIGNGDAHAKNLSLLHTAPGIVELAPLYDTVPTVLWPNLPDRAAMHIGGVTRLSSVTVEDVVAEAERWHVDPATAEDAVVDVVTRALGMLDTMPENLAHAISARTRKLLGQ